MKLYVIKKGTTSKLLTQKPDTNITVKPWVTTKELTFNQPVLDAVGYSNAHPKPPRDSLAVRLIHEGYSLFSESGKANDEYILAVKSTDVELLI